MTLPTPASHRRSSIVPWAVVGIVEANDDPLDLGRVRVSFPTLHPGPWSFWLRIAAPMAGSGSGFFAVPHLGDEVLVVFLHGHPDMGVVIGHLWNGVDRPPPEGLGADPSQAPSDPPRRDDEPAHQYVWRSRRGHLLLFDDTPGNESVQLMDRTRTLAIQFDSASETLHIRNDRGDVEIFAKGTLRLAAHGNVEIDSNQSIRATSAQDTIFEVGADYRLSATGEAHLSSGGVFQARSTGASLRCMAATSTRIEGLTTHVYGSSRAIIEGKLVAQITGGMVKLN